MITKDLFILFILAVIFNIIAAMTGRWNILVGQSLFILPLMLWWKL